MIRLTLVRIESGDQGTFGYLDLPTLRVFTGELPWRNNEPNLSCIPEGLYLCRLTFSPHFRKLLYEVTGVKGRTGIRIHSANFMGDRTLGLKSQLYGCIALGEKFGTMDGQRALLLSTPAVRRFEKRLQGQPFELEVIGGGTTIRRPD